MPPRYAYWTIIVDDQPTAFRASAQEDLMPTFKRLKERHPSAAMKWFQNGKLWPSRLDAQEAMRARGERGRIGDARQGGGFRDRKRNGGDRFRPPARDGERDRPKWTPKTSEPENLKTSEKLEWKPKGEFTPEPKRSERPEWKPKTHDARPKASRSERPEWKPKGSFDRDRKPEWKSRSGGGSRPGTSRSQDFKTSRPQDVKTSRPRARAEKLEWKPKGEAGSAPREKRAWVPKAEYKKAQGIEVPRDQKWRPGGEHRDPRQKYKDAKKAKWTKFKKTIRTRWEAKNKKKS